MSADDEAEVRRVLRAALFEAGCGGGLYCRVDRIDRAVCSPAFFDACWARLTASAEEQKKLEQADPLALELSWAAAAAIWYLDPFADARAATIDREPLGSLLDDPLRFLCDALACDALARRAEPDGPDGPLRWAVLGPPPAGAVRE